MQLSRVHHISLNVTDAARDTKFYTEILGFQAIPRPEMGFKGAWLAMGDQQLHLLEVPGFEAPKGQHFAFDVTDIEAARAHLMAQGVDVSEPLAMADVCWQCFFKDPSGNLLELNQALGAQDAGVGA